jgi:hypothetical protein
LPIVLAVATVWGLISATPAVVVCANRDGGADERDSYNRGGSVILLLDHRRAVVSHYSAPTEFHHDILLKNGILALEIRPAKGRLVDCLWIFLEFSLRCGAARQGNRKHCGYGEPRNINDFQFKFPNFPLGTCRNPAKSPAATSDMDN